MIKMFKWYFDWANRMVGIEADLDEIKRQNKRIDAAYKLHRDVLKNYGPEAYSHLASPEEIIKDTKTITVHNYLDTDFIRPI